MRQEVAYRIMDELRQLRLTAVIGMRWERTPSDPLSKMFQSRGASAMPDAEFDVIIPPSQEINVHQLVDRLRLLGCTLMYGAREGMQGETWTILPPPEPLAPAPVESDAYEEPAIYTTWGGNSATGGPRYF